MSIHYSSLPRSQNIEAFERLRESLGLNREEFVALLEAEEERPAFDPMKVRDLLKTERARGREPGYLLLGKREMVSFYHFVSRGPDEDVGVPERDFYFFGVKVVGVERWSCVELAVDDLRDQAA